MLQKTAIEWTDHTWNVWSGCTKVSEGCKFCYAETIATRFGGKKAFPLYFNLTYRPHKWEEPLHMHEPKLIFVNSMTDVFYEPVPDDTIVRLFEIQARADRHIFQNLTKRTSRMKQLSAKIRWADNIWMGVSVENQRRADERIPDLQAIPAALRFLSIEPLLGPIAHLPLEGIGWVICGGESGPHHRPIDPAWVREIRDQCLAVHVPFFFKQWGGRTPKAGGKELDGRVWDEFPTDVYRRGLR